jgi:hypothetical protein
MIEIDHKVVFGDMNFRLNMPFEQAVAIADEVTFSDDVKSSIHPSLMPRTKAT